MPRLTSGKPILAVVAAGRSGPRRFRASAPEGFRFTLRYVWRRLRGQAGRFGVAGVTFGRPVSLGELAESLGPEDDLVKTLGERLKEDIRAGVPLVTVPLIMAAMISRNAPSTFDDIVEGIRAIRSGCIHSPPDFSVSAEDTTRLKGELGGLVMRDILTVDGDQYRIAEPDLASFYANSISQYLAADAALQLSDYAESQKSSET